MDKTLRILVVEDREADAILTERQLRQAGIAFVSHRVEEEDAFLKELQEFGPDIILSDYYLPRFDGMKALQLAKQFAPFVPFVVVTGSLNEEIAVECMKAGAWDYVLKGHITRLGFVVKNVLETRHAAMEKARAEELLTRLSRIAEQTDDIVCVTDTRGVIEYVNPAFENFTGFSREEAIGKTHAILKSGRHDKRFYETFWKTIVSGRSFRGTFINRKKNGEIYHDEKIVTPLKDADGKITHFVSTGRDVTEQKKTEEALQRSEELFRVVTENSSDLITIITRGGKIYFSSSALERVLGYKPEERIGADAFELIHPDDIPVVTDAVAKAWQTPGVPVPVQFRVRHRDGAWRVLDSVGKTMPESSGIEGMIINSRDITERRRMEEELRQSQKIEAIGRLAGGVAHDFNNILMAVTGYCELLLLKLGPDHPACRDVRETLRAAEQGGSLTRQLLAFSRKQILEPKVLELNQVVSGMESLLRRLIPENIELIFILTPQAGRIKADRGQIEQVVMNLAVNARDAMPRGGKLIIETSTVVWNEGELCNEPDCVQGNYDLLTVTDTGCGMDEATRLRIFEPFFSTKELGKGTGLGLATVYGIVKQSGGCIRVESAVGKGTTFTIYLPRIDEPATMPAPIETSAKEPLSGTETIFLVDDNEALRTAIAGICEKYGYSILQASDGEDALDVARKHAGAIDLLITDVVMPKMNGPELAAALEQDRKGIKVLYMSGYSQNAIHHGGVLESGVSYLQKPASAAGLLRKVREVLDGRT